MRRWVFGACAIAGAIFACGDFDSDDAPAPSDGGVDATTATDAPIDSGTPVEAASEAGPSREYRYVFVTSGAHDGKFRSLDASLDEVDVFCANTALANDELKGLRWRAWLGTSKATPRDRVFVDRTIPHDYQLVTGDVVFRAGFKYVDGTEIMPLHRVDHDENGLLVVNTPVWTGSTDDGKTSPNANCNDWSDNAGLFSAAWGWAANETVNQSPSLLWLRTTAPADVCQPGTLKHVYCFEVDP